MLSEAKQRAVRFIYPYGSVRRVLRGPMRGIRYVVEPGIGFTYSLGVEASQSRFFAQRVRPAMTVYDIGANRGQMALLFSRLVGVSGRVLSFEPVPELCQSIRRNLALNDLSNVTVHCAAIAEHNGREAFNFSDAQPTVGKIARLAHDGGEIRDARRVEVATTSLDTLMEAGAPPPDFMKIDVEGGGAAVFRGARSLLERHAPAIYIELHGPEEQAAVRDCLMSVGYRVERLDGVRVEDPVARWQNPLFCYHPDRSRAR